MIRPDDDDDDLNPPLPPARLWDGLCASPLSLDEKMVVFGSQRKNYCFYPSIIGGGDLLLLLLLSQGNYSVPTTTKRGDGEWSPHVVVGSDCRCELVTR